MKVLNKGEIKIINVMGGDQSVLRAARVSNGEIEDFSKGAEKDGKLINYLMKHKHGTPFEHNAFTLYVKAPIFVFREWQRHRIGSFNEISGRYVEFEPEFYIPDLLRVPGDTNKQGSKIPEISPTKDFDTVEKWHHFASELIYASTENAFRFYKALLDVGVAKEMARMVLPVNLYSQMYWTINARALMNFIALRNAPNAQWEIQEYAKIVEEILGMYMPATYQAFIDNGRVAP